MEKTKEAEYYLGLYKEDLLYIGLSIEETTFHMQIARNYAIDFLIRQQFAAVKDAAKPSNIDTYIVDFMIRNRLVRSKKSLHERLESLKRFLDSLSRHRRISSQSLSKAFLHLEEKEEVWANYLKSGPKSGR